MSGTETFLQVRDYDLDATLDSGQVFRWRKSDNSWLGVTGKHPVRLTRESQGIHVQTTKPVEDWDWIREFLQTEVDPAEILKTFPDDPPMRAAIAACHGLRVLRQEPWECLASFILSSTKQIVQIRQIISLLCERYGNRFPASFPATQPFQRTGQPGACAPQTSPGLYSFPAPEKIAAASESELRVCKMGFRAPHLLAAARQIADGTFDLDLPRRLPLAEARAELTKLAGVGNKIADCVLLFAYGFDEAFPVDVWVERALHRLYFPRRHLTPKRLRHFASTHFGPHAGYAQQYLFHYIRTKMK